MNTGINRHPLLAALAMIAGATVPSVAYATPAGGLLRHGIVPGEFAQADSIAVEIEPMPLLKASKELAKIFGAPVKVVKTLEPSTLAVYAPSTTPEELRAKIAIAYNATWALREGIWYLDQTTQQVRAEAAIELERRRIAVRKMLEKAQKAKAAQKPFTDTEARSLFNQLKDLTKGGFKDEDGSMWRRMEQLENQGPEKRLMDRIISKLNEDMFLAVPENERRVFSLKPTAMQIPLRIDAQEDVRKFVEEQNTWSTTTGGQVVGGDDEGGAYGRLSYNVKLIDQPVDNILLSIRANQDNNFTVECSLVDPKGHYLSEGFSSSYSFDESDNPNIEMLYGMGEKAKEHEKKLSKDSLNFRRLLLRVDPVTNKPVEPDADFILKAMRVSQKDPLAYSSWDYLKQEAKDLNISLAGSIPESTVYISYGLLGFMRDQKTKEVGDRFLAMRAVEENGWMVIAPANPVRERREYRDRTKLETQILLRANNKSKSLDAEAAYVLTLPDDESYSMMDELIRRFTKNDEPIYNDRFFLRLYGLIPSNMRAALATEQGVRLNQMPREVQKAIYKRVYFGDRWSLQYVPQGDYDEEKSSLFWNGIMRESTVSMASGIPNSAIIKMKITDEPILKTAPQQRPYGIDQGQFVTAEELAQRTFYKSRPDLFPWAADNDYYSVNPKGLKVYRKREISFTIDFKNELQMTGALTEAEATESGTYTIDNLPAEFKKKYQEQWKQLQEQAKNMHPGMSGPSKSPKKDIPPL
jgi:hypothetical protein